MLKIVGVQRVSGDFNGNHYDNINFHVLNDAPSRPTIAGSTCEIIKVKTADIPAVFGGLISTDPDYRSVIGMALNVFYDRYGRVINATVSDYKERG